MAPQVVEKLVAPLAHLLEVEVVEVEVEELVPMPQVVEVVEVEVEGLEVELEELVPLPPQLVAAHPSTFQKAQRVLRHQPWWQQRSQYQYQSKQPSPCLLPHYMMDWMNFWLM